MAALPTHAAIQYPHAVWKPTKSPNARRLYSYGPPVRGNARPRLANTIASRNAPAAVTVQPTTLTPAPYAASETGKRNTPEPIMLPTTSAVAIGGLNALRCVVLTITTSSGHESREVIVPS